MPVPRSEGVAAVVDGRIFWIGGRVPSQPGADHFSEHEDSSLTHVYDPSTRQWSTRAPAPTARNSAAAAVIDGKIFVVGGRRFAGMENSVARQVNFSNLEVYDPKTDTWAIKSPMPQGQGGLGAAVVDDDLYVCGGERWLPAAGVHTECWRYDVRSDKWAASTPLPIARHGIGMAAVGPPIYVFGGGVRPGGSSATDLNQVLHVSE